MYRKGDTVWIRSSQKKMGGAFSDVAKMEKIVFPVECYIYEPYTEWAKVRPKDRTLMSPRSSWWNFTYEEIFLTPSDEHLEEDLFEL